MKSYLQCCLSGRPGNLARGTCFTAVWLTILLLGPSVRACSVGAQESGEGRPLFHYSVVHDHWIGSERGDLSFFQDRMVFEAGKKPAHSRSWDFLEIAQLKIVDDHRIEVLTYEDVGWLMNRDRRFSFNLASAPADRPLVGFLRQRLGTRLVTGIAEGEGAVLTTVRAKHLHWLLDGCSGTLQVLSDGIVFVSQNPEHTRSWPDAQIVELGRNSEYGLRVRVRETSLEGNLKNYQFQLKEHLDAGLYDRLWRRLFEPRSWLNSIGSRP